MSRLFVLDRRIVLAPAIWPKGRTIEIEAGVPPLRFEGWITAELIHARTGFVKQRLSFRNLVVDAGLDALGGGPSTLGYMSDAYLAVGTGATAPAVTDTQLVAEVVRTNATGGFAATAGSGASFAYWYRRITRNFTEAQANGVLAELSLFKNAAGAPMWARQLFKDAGGVPTTITKTAADQLRITWETRAYSPTVDATGTTLISGTNYDWVTRAAQIDVYENWSCQDFGGWGNLVGVAGDVQTLAATTGFPASTQSAASSSTVLAAYGAGTFYRDIEFVWEPSVANFTGGGIGNLCHRPMSGGYWGAATNSSFQTSFTPKFAKDSTKRLRVTFRYPWTRF